MEVSETYKQVRSIKRGLDILAALNESGHATVAQLSDKTGVHRTTIYRILDTLKSLGYVREELGEECYGLTHKVQRLSSNISERTRVADAAAPCLRALMDEVDWPTSVGCYVGNSMVIEETTHGISPLFVHRVTVGTRSPVLCTAMGRAYIAFCGESERQEILSALTQADCPERRVASDQLYVRDLIAKTRERGFGFSFGDSNARFGSVAVPIRSEERAVGCINVVFFTTAVSRDAAIREYVSPLYRAAANIEASLALM